MGIDERKKKEGFGFFIRHRLDSGGAGEEWARRYGIGYTHQVRSFEFNSDENGSWNAKYMMLALYSRRFRYNAT